MYSLLIVDDEKFAADGISRCGDWGNLGIEQVYVAYHAREARAILLSSRIDVMICDIEMPDENGLELVAWVKANSPHTESVFLTCHSEFAFAKQAVQLGSFDYLLKPVDEKELFSIVETMLRAVEDKAEQKHYNDMYSKYKSLWDKQQPILAERFWGDFLSRRILTFGDFLARALEDAQLPLSVEHKVMPILISVEEWLRALGERDKEIMEYAVKKAAEELFLEGRRGHVILDKNGLLFVMVYAAVPSVIPPYDPAEWRAAAERFIQASAQYFFCRLSCYIGQYASFEELNAQCEELQGMERANVTSSQTTVLLPGHRGQAAEASEEVSSPEATAGLKISGWSEYLMNGNREKLTEVIRQTVRRLEASQQVDAVLIESCYHDILQIIYHFMQVKGLTANQIPNFSLWTSAKIRSLAQLQNWAIQLTGAVMDAVFVRIEDDLVIGRAMQYMREHVEEDISREDVAAYVELNPAYLSRLFRRKTGKNIIDFLIDSKMQRAKELLKNTDLTVSAVAQSLGYVNFSYFSKAFKKVYGMNPQDYRKQ
ncbi:MULTISPECIES: helix-turn-helix domain-containing protein [Paenibacillus]|uniref:helix-turn-helix domain-containing protein n=1 Tax=Paenibacillus TaxID=44249 RepID=UPI0022B8ABA6|nr:helix-turn-helix domain-containing protein [Paenibacillus caseinilyticus]MCZ8518297.1 response regulator [Paenibacillus caseinilyticus]